MLLPMAEPFELLHLRARNYAIEAGRCRYCRTIADDVAPTPTGGAVTTGVPGASAGERRRSRCQARPISGEWKPSSGTTLMVGSASSTVSRGARGSGEAGGDQPLHRPVVVGAEHDPRLDPHAPEPLLGGGDQPPAAEADQVEAGPPLGAGRRDQWCVARNDEDAGVLEQRHRLEGTVLEGEGGARRSDACNRPSVR